MQIRYVCSLWGMNQSTLAESLQAIKSAGYDGVEAWAPGEEAQRREFRAMLTDLELDLVSQQWTFGNSPAAHVASFEEQYLRNIELRPCFVNSHTGVDHYLLEENLPIFDHASELAERHGISVLHETHRGRPTFSAPSTVALLDARPQLALTADFSHWCCVHESLLQDQAGRVRRASEHAYYIHARVGHAQGPQVPDPRVPEWQDALVTHLRWWQDIVDIRFSTGAGSLYVCTEFGPPDYMTRLPFTRMPISDQWKINLYMKKYLQQNLRTGSRSSPTDTGMPTARPDDQQ